MKPRHDNAGANRDRMRGATPEAIVGVLMLTGQSGDAAVVELPLQVNGAELGVGLPGIPIAFPCRIGRISSSLITTTLDADPWNLAVQVRRAGSDFFNDVASFDVSTPAS